MGSPLLEALLDRVDEIAPAIRDGAAESERLGRLAPSVVDALHRADLFRMLLPIDLGGSGLTIPESIEVLERVASLDTSTGWTLTILADGPLLTRRLGRDVFETISADPTALVAGSLNPATARAERAEGGYVFSGTATYLSGSAHAHWLSVAAVVTEHGRFVIEDGALQIRGGTIPIEQARCLDTWHVAGMRATSSSHYEFHEVPVAEAWTFDPFVGSEAGHHADDIFARIPLIAQLGGGLVANATGAARNAIDRFADLAAGKVPVGGDPARLAERPNAHRAVGEAEGLFRAAHATLAVGVDPVWRRGAAGLPFQDVDVAGYRVSMVTAVRLAAQAVDLIHDVAGMDAVMTGSIIDRCWRDVHTITQHVLLAPNRYDIAGRVLLGLDAGVPVI
jgi:alkylation response protein AidB-like acyl-CoA dehydrogenase